MRRPSWCRWLLAGCLAAGSFGIAVGPGWAGEESQKFIEALRERRLYDMALEYLQQMRSSPLAGAEFETVIDYEMGVTLKDASRVGGVAKEREKQLDQARASFQKFLAEHADHPLAPGANTQLADLLVERGRIKAEQAAKPGKSADEKNQLTGEARAHYTEAQTIFGELEKRFSEEHQKFPKLIDKKDTKQIEQRDQVRRNLLEARLALATVVYEIAETYEPASKESKDHLTAAAAKYSELYNKYGTRVAGLYARMWEGRCYKELGDSAMAYEAFEELLLQPGEAPAFRALKNKALILLLETTLLPSEKKYPKAIEEAQKWEKGARGREESSDEGLVIKYLAGEATLAYARTLDPSEKEQRSENLKKAERLFKFVARFSGEYQKQAKQQLRAKEFVGEDFVRPEPTSFEEARDRAKDALDLLQDPDLKPEEAVQPQEQAIEYYRMALAMRTPETTTDEINVIRYYLAYLYWKSQAVYEAAVVGEFLATYYPSSPGARQGAKIAMAAYANLLDAAKAAEKAAADETQQAVAQQSRSFAERHMVKIAELITERWAGQSEADEAWTMLIRTALANGELEKARGYLDKISPDSPRRSQVELMTGQQLWAAYLRATIAEGDQRPPQAELDAMVRQAQEILETGIGRMSESVDAGGEVTYTLLASVLSLAQIHIGAGQPDQAVTWLDKEKIGAHTMVKAAHPATDRGNFRVETYKAALRSYVATQQVEQAEEVMEGLEELVKQGGDAGAEAKLTKIYISLGSKLEKQIERLRNEEDDAQLETLSQGFERFLERISQREEGNTFSSLNWVAGTFLKLGRGFDPNGTELPPEAEKYYQKAADTYQKILQLCKEKKPGFETGDTTRVRIGLAQCLRGLGKYKEAMGQLRSVLKARPTMVPAQVEAAYTYQDWGSEKSGYYELAIMGSSKYKEIWGWGRLAKRVASSKKHRLVFHEARYNLALCRYHLALKKSKKEKTKILAQAEMDILVVQRLYPEMGGSSWYGRYDVLLKKIQKLRNKKAGGLSAAATRKKKTAEKTKTTASK